eukprot:TRINITY_DN7109_c0_g2_i1.p1 TRINITY_DN7109_c0_g2~~TRINITY_DN7109_c0_g2_i1.p1  ORF type:complete len:1919 (+),score=538.84 TRINITY_DN7109_c0_g2_i1:80-5836(+)
MAESPEEQFLRLVQSLLDSAKLPGNQRDPLRFDVATGLLPLIASVPKQVFSKVQEGLEAALIAALIQATGMPLQRALVGCLIAMYKSGRSYHASATFGAFEDALGKAGSSKEATKAGLLDAMGCMVAALGRMLPCASAAPAVLKQLKSDEVMVRCSAIRTLAAMVRSAGPDIPRGDILKPVGRAVTDLSPDVRVACGEAVAALAESQGMLTVGAFDGLKELCFKGLDDPEDAVQYSFGSALASILLLAVQQGAQVGSDDKKKNQSIFSSKKNDPAVFTVPQAVAVCCECFTRATASRNLRSGLMHAILCMLLELSKQQKLPEVASSVVAQVLLILESPKSFETADAYLHARACVCEALSKGVVSQLDEPGQQAMAKSLCEFMARGSHSEMYSCAVFSQLTQLCGILGATMTSIQGDVIAQCMAGVSSAETAVRLAAATSLGALATALSEQRYALLQYCVNVVNTHKETGITARAELQSLHGHVHAASALIASAANSTLGIPFHVTDDILETATLLLQLNEDKAYEAGETVAAAYWEAGWVLVGSMMQLGATWTSPRLTKLFALWKMALTRKPAAKQDGKSITAEFRARMFALSALCTFTKSCRSLLNDQLIKVVLLFLWQTIEPIRSIPEAVKALEPVRMAMSLLKAKVYTALLLLPPSSTGNRLAVLAQMTVSDLCDSTNGKLSVVALLSPQDETLGPALDGSNGRLASYGYSSVPNWGDVTPLDIWGDVPSQVFGECSLVGQRLLEAALSLFCHLFAAQTAQNQTRVLEHLAPVIKESAQTTAKSGRERPTVVQTVCAALLQLLKHMVQRKQRVQPSVSLSSLLDAACVLVGDEMPEMRRAGSEMLGCLAWLSQGASTNAVLPHALQSLQSSSPHVKAGWALALGCVSSFQPSMSMGSPRKNDTLNVTVSSIQHLAGDANPEVAAWALHSLWKAIETTGSGFSPLTASTLARLYGVCTGENAVSLGMLSAMAKIVRTIVGSMGPELAQGAEITNKCNSLARFVHACSVCTQLEPLLTKSYGPTHLGEISLEAVRTVRNQLVFAPHLIVARDELPFLLQALEHSNVCVREEATQCVFHIVRRDPEVLDKDFALASLDGTEHSLEATLFDMLSEHGNSAISSVIEEAVSFVLRETCLLQPSRIVYQCRRIVTGATGQLAHKAKSQAVVMKPDRDDDDDTIHNSDDEAAPPEAEVDPASGKTQAVRWQAKKFAVQCLLGLIEHVRANGAENHFDPRKGRKAGEGLVLMLSELASVAFTCALSEVEGLRPFGLEVFTQIVDIFGDTQNPDAEGILLVEDFVAQISAAVREAFSPDALPGVTAAACNLCTSFMQNVVCFGDKNMMKRIKGFMGSPLDSLSTLRYNAYYESESSRVQAAFLKAHSKLFMVDNPEVNSMSRELGHKLLAYWLDFLRDCASLSLLSFDDLKKMAAASGCFFSLGSAQQVAPIFGAAEGPVLRAAIAALKDTSGKQSSTPRSGESTETTVDIGYTLNLLLGFCVRNLLAAAAPGMLRDGKSGVRGLPLSITLQLEPHQTATEQIDDVLTSLSQLFSVKAVPELIEPATMHELFRVFAIVASSAFTERSPRIAASLGEFLAHMLHEVAGSASSEMVVQRCIELLLSNQDFPVESAIHIFAQAFTSSSPETAITFAHPAAEKALQLLRDPSCDDANTRSSFSVLKSVAALSHESSLTDAQRDHAVAVLHAAVTTATNMLMPHSTTPPNFSLGLMALLAQLDPSKPACLSLQEAAGDGLGKLALSEEACVDARRKAVVTMRNLSQSAGQPGEQQDGARAILRYGMKASVLLVGSSTAPEDVRCEALTLLLFGLEAAGEQHKAQLMELVAPLTVHMLKDSEAAVAVAGGLQAITALAPQPEFKAQLALLPASMKADLQRALTSGPGKQGAGGAKTVKQKAKINFSSFRK